MAILVVALAILMLRPDSFSAATALGAAGARLVQGAAVPTGGSTVPSGGGTVPTGGSTVPVGSGAGVAAPRVVPILVSRTSAAVTPLRVTAAEAPVEAEYAAAEPTLRLVMTGVGGAPEATATPRPRVVLASAAAPEAALEAPVEAAPVATATAVAEEEATPAATEEAVSEEAAAEPAPMATEEAVEEAEEEATPVAEEEVAPVESVTETVPLTETAPVTEAVPMSPTAVGPAETGEGVLLDVVDTAAAMGNLTTLVAAIEAAGLGDILRSEGPYTIFAPTDEAFAALPTGRLDELMADPGGDLLDILLYHVLPGRVMTANVSDGQQLETIQGATVTFTVGKGGVLINATNIITPDIEATNGVVHVIGHVLSAPVGEGEEVPPGEEVTQGEVVTDSGVMTATGMITATGEITGSEEVTGSGEVTPSNGATLTVPIIVSDGVTGTGAITDTEPLTGSVPVTDGEAVSDTAAGNATETAAVQAAVVVSPPARRPSAPIAAPAEVWAAPEGPLEVFAPVSGGAYHSPIDVTGLARTFTGHVAISLVGEDGTLLAERATVGGTGDEYAFFATYLRFTVSEPTGATLHVTDMDMAEGTVMAQVSVPVTLLPGQRAVDVTYPAVGDRVCGALTAGGYSNTFEANVVVELLAHAGGLLEQLPAMGGTLGFYRDFVAPLAYTLPAGPEALLLVASESDAGGRYPHIDRTAIPFTLYPAGSEACATQ
ncbi:MAG: fasciclin domain-containing protein [Caldilineaceae bacterium]|nr:fasciclin domain-containing protein [Caldilineaceae bacterium]